ncbi:beta-ketoacyl-[acyl-carrier-protein] synthase family protein [Polaromonas glacialis]|uniref:beta-ketoacyl-[acyl-carrier-protein] synthase family protein n=1 Tax=Polaromonas glacialis TaxID=866564 RepID=UPI0004953120|nr:beta-ketoacyl-[acyl-carrier-protein] synthase family protein [Polaromonas glacialis]
MRRVAVTGMGVVSPLGHGAAEAFAAARAGRSAIHRLDAAFAHRLAAPLGATVAFNGAEHFDPPQLRMLDRVSQFALVAARQALADARPALAEAERHRAGIFVGTGMGGIGSIDDGYQTLYGENSDRVKPFLVLTGMHNAPAAWIGIEHNWSGPNLSYSTACSSSAVAIGEAWLRLARGDIDLALAGGAEAPLCFGSLKAWEALRTVASIDTADPSASCKPFSENRSGMVLGEGAAMLVLEPWDRALARGATIHGELAGYGLCTDAGHITRPSVEGQAATLRAALESAGMDAGEVDAINAHGTGTPANDGIETAAIKAVFGSRAARIPISATKALHGHLLGATSALECVLSLMAMQHSVALPTMHLQQADPQCDLDYVPNAAREGVAVRSMLSSSFAFGGTNAVLALRAAG